MPKVVLQDDIINKYPPIGTIIIPKTTTTTVIEAIMNKLKTIKSGNFFRYWNSKAPRNTPNAI